MSIQKTIKVSLLTTLLAAMMGLTACDKKAEDSPEQDANADVPMSAEPAENSDPVIVADDLDDVDSQADLEGTEPGSDVDPSSSAIEDSSSTPAVENAPVTDSQIGPEEGTVLEENTPSQ